MPTDTADVAELAFPKLDDAELRMLARMAATQTYADGETIFRAGDAGIDLFVIKSGAIDIINPSNEDRLIVTHQPGEFAGDIDLLTRRPVIVNAVAGDFAGVAPHVRRKVRVGVINTRIHDADDNAAAASGDVPCFRCIDVRVPLAAGLARVIQAPVVGGVKLVVGRGRFGPDGEIRLQR